MLNYVFVIRQMGLLLIVISGSILLSSFWEIGELAQGRQQELKSALALWISAAIGALIGWFTWFKTRKCDDYLGHREALLLVACSWLFGAALAALPFFLWAQMEGGPEHPFRNWIGCYFESMSGLTTTGASVLGSAPNDIESLPRGLLLWRSVTHWLGGLGIVVLFVAVLPTLGVGGKKIFQVETTGPTQQGVRPKIRETARILWVIYLGLTVIETLLLRWAGMNWFDALNHTFATLATGGFSTKNDSAGSFSLGVNAVIITFMFLAGVNFGLYYKLFRGRWKEVIRDTELIAYFLLVVIGSIVISFFLMGNSFMTTGGVELDGFGNSVEHSFFQVLSIQTTTGFGSADFNQWHYIPKCILFGLMFVGGCAGSTGGGIKVIRIIIAFRVMLAEIERVFRPNVVRSVKIGKTAIDPELRLATVVYVFGIFILSGVGAFLIYAFELERSEIDVTTAISASVATLNNIGPGFGMVGPTQNFGWFSNSSLSVMCILMALGRLEVYAILVLFVPRFWSAD